MEDKIKKIIFSKRKTISISVNDKGFVVVKAPIKTHLKEIFEIVHKHKNWITKKINLINAVGKFEEKKFVDGEEFWFLGKKYKLHISDNVKEKLVFNDGFFLDKKYIKSAKNIFINWYKKQAYTIIEDRLKFYSKKSNLTYKKLKITSASKRWGSCSKDNNLNFSYKLIMAPIEVIDYVVVHELSHTIHHNHSKAFWKKVEELYPQFRDAKDYLSKFGHLFNL